MAAEYQIKVYDTTTPTGALKAIVTDFLEIKYANIVNDPGVLYVTVDGGHSALTDLTSRDYLIEVWRRNVDYGISWYCDFAGLSMDFEKKRVDHNDVATVICPGLMSILGRRIVAYRDNQANITRFTDKYPGQIAEALCKYNLGSLAVGATDPNDSGELTERIIDGTLDNWVWTDAAVYPSSTLIDLETSAFQNLLDLVIDLADGNDEDFSVNNYTGAVSNGYHVGNGSRTLKLKFYADQLGTDRTASVLFALNRENMKDPVLRRNQSSEKTAAIVGGFGEGSKRKFSRTTHAQRYSAGDNDSEVYVDARKATTAAARAKAGRVALRANRRVRDLEFTVVQAPQTAYGEHYFLGDLVTASYGGMTLTEKVMQVNIGYVPGQLEVIDVILEEDYGSA